MFLAAETTTDMQSPLDELIPGSLDTAQTDAEEDQQELAAVARAFGSTVLNRLPNVAWEPFVESVPIGFARSHVVLALQSQDGGDVELAVGDGKGLAAIDIVRRLFQRPVRPVFVKPERVREAINHAYEEHGGTTREVLHSMEYDEGIQIFNESQDLLDSSGKAPVIRLVNQLLFEAIKSRASDIHVQPAENAVVARLRIDGVLFDTIEIPKSLQDEVVSRIKVLGSMNVAEKRMPQDGRATVRIADRVIDLRIASLPTSHSERVVIRLLDKSARLYTLTELGMPGPTLDRFSRLISLEHGLLLVTGPTGSGKSTTLYASLQQIRTSECNILTLEDPIEYELEGVSQTQINEKKGLTFAKGLRNVLRQDPDIIMVGEIRDRDTAVMAIQSSLTGHLVFSTLHTNDSASAVTRMLDLGIEPYLVASSLVGVLAQRLVRRVCAHCRRESPPDEAQQGWLDAQKGFVPERTYIGEGCDVCRGTGFKGRVGIFELLVVDDRCRSLIQKRANASELRDAAVSSGMTLLAEDGLRKVSEGQTALAEVMRVAQRSSD